MSDSPIRKKSKNEIHVHPHTKRLARYFGYTPNDLLFNRQGFLSPRQIKTIRNRLITTLFVYLSVIIGFLIVGIIVFSIPWAQEIIATEGIFSNILQPTVFDWLILVIGGITLFLFALMIRQINLSRDNIQRGKIQRYIGSANRQMVDFTNRASYRDNKYLYNITIGDRTFDVDGDLFKLCQKNFVYCAYVASAMNDILAMEVIDNSIQDMPEWMQEIVDSTSHDDFRPVSTKSSMLEVLGD